MENTFVDANLEHLIIDLASEFSEQTVAGHNPSIKEYLEKLPDAASRKAFKAVVNTSRLLTTIQIIDSDSAIEAEQPGLAAAESIGHGSSSII